ncbi:MAG: hypothetical protein ACREVR_03885, partial [Burkholderiales bacterium]
FDEGKIKRKPKGAKGGGQFAPKLSPTDERAFEGQARKSRKSLSKLETGQLGELLAIEYLRRSGIKDARTMNIDRNNYPIDLLGDHRAIEVKAGLASNGKSAQQWRATVGQPGPAETKWLRKASPAAKAKWHERKLRAVITRKERAVREVSRKTGRQVRGMTVATIIDHDRRVVDVYKFDGFHSRIAWNSEQAKKAYAGSFKYR